MTKPLSKWLTRKAGKKPIGATPQPDQTDGKRVNNFDVAAPGPIVQDGFGDSDPNALGPNMRPLYHEFARPASHWADQHDANPEDVPYPRIQRGAVAEGSRSARFRGKTGDDERFGPAGQFDPVDYPFAGKTQGSGGNQADNGDANNVIPGRRNRSV